VAHGKAQHLPCAAELAHGKTIFILRLQQG
jgi:hypothetical protein